MAVRRASAGRPESWVVDTLDECEPRAVRNQPPVVWHRASGARVWDEHGRCWLDWTSGILTANAGHAPAEVVDAICAVARRGLLHAYAFPTAERARVVRALTELTGFPQVVVLTTGSEAVEAAIKIARTRARSAGRRRAVVVSFDGAFHGRTMGAQLAGGFAEQRHWTVSGDGDFVHVPFPAAGVSWRSDVLEETLRATDASPSDVACVVVEPYQGSTLTVLDGGAARALADWCRTHDVLLVFDEIQSGFGRTGRLFGYEWFGVRPDLVVCGKGLSGSLPASAVLVGDRRLTDALRPGELSTTHGANPVALATVEANLRLFADGALVAQARDNGRRLAAGLAAWAGGRPGARVVGAFGMVAGITLVGRDGRPDAAACRRLVDECCGRGLLVCAPVGRAGALVKVMPPLVTTAAELDEALAILAVATDATL